jgi:hypothetical protein
MLDQILDVQKYISRPKRGVFNLGFEVDLGQIFLDLGIIDGSTNWEEVVAPQELPYPTFPTFRALCVWIPEANLYVWPSLQKYQSELKLSMCIQLPPGCPLAKSLLEKFTSLYSEESSRKVTFFIEPGYPDFEFGISVPKEFADERIKAGGFGSACIEYKEEEIYRQFRLVVGRFPSNIFAPYFPEPLSVSFGEFEKHLRRLKSFEKNRKTNFEELGWEFEDHNEYNASLSTAKHKYMKIEIFNSES